MKHEYMVGARIPKTLVKELERIERAEQTDRSTTVRKLLARAIQDWNLEHSGAQYRQGKLSMARAAQEAGVTLWEFQSYLRDNKIAVQYDRLELEHDLATIKAFQFPDTAAR
jgi:predicted HTH domain antitoxin